MAVFLIDGSISFAAAHDTDRFNDPVTMALREKVDLTGDNGLVTPESPRQGIVELQTRDGKSYRDHVVAVRGAMENPMTTEEVESKARDLLTPALGTDKANRLIMAVGDLESMGSAQQLRELLSR